MYSLVGQDSKTVPINVPSKFPSQIKRLLLAFSTMSGPVEKLQGK